MLYLSGIILSFFLAFLLLTKKHKSGPDYILVAWLAVLGFHLLSFYLLYTGQDSKYPYIVAMGMPLPLAHGPFLFLYTRQQTIDRPFTANQLLHFLPLLASYAMFIPFFTLSVEQQAAVFMQRGKGFELQSAINLYAIYISGTVYVALSLIRLIRYRRNLVHQFSNTEKINFNWLLYLIIWMAIIWAIVLFVQHSELVFGAAALFAIWIAYFSIRQVQVYSHSHAPSPPQAPQISGYPVIEVNEAPPETTEPLKESPETQVKYQKSNLSEQDAALIHGRLMKLMAEQKPFTDPELTLNDLSEKLTVHPNILSQVINSVEGKNFYDLVNAGRVEEFIRRVSEPGVEQYTLLSIAFDCGFNSKASFNRNFKKYKGITPSEYLKVQLN
jgi:AraC-like DNA-binding protein